MQSQAYNQAVKTIVTATIAKLKSFQVSANQARNLKASNKDLLALVVELQGDIKLVETSTKKNMWKVWQEVATLAPARSWDVFNQRIEEVLNNWATLLATAETCIAAFEQAATAETLTEGQEVLTSIGQKATVEAVTEHGVVIAFADNSGKTTTDAKSLHPLNKAAPAGEMFHVSWQDMRNHTRYTVTSYDAQAGWQTTGQYDRHQEPAMALTSEQVEDIRYQFENKHRTLDVVPVATKAD